MSAADAIARRIHREGPIPFEAFMNLALYDAEHGFFARGRGAGRAARDFLTSPEVGPLFGACVARELDRRWTEFGEPDPFLVVEAGAGVGRLAREVQRAAPACGSALRYVLVERSAVLRGHQRELLPLEPADEALGPFARRMAEDEIVSVPRAGPVFASLEDLPEMPIDSVLFANELLDNLPFGIGHWDGQRWHEVRVADQGGTFAEVLVPATADDARALNQVVEGRRLPVGARLPIARGLQDWLDECGSALHRGVVVLVDYMAGVEAVIARGDEWLRTYREHGRGVDPLLEPGTQDITADLVRVQVERAARAAGFVVVDDRSQSEWLHDLGIDGLVAEGRRQWEEGAHRGDLNALTGRSRSNEAAALTDPGGLGAHRVVTLATAARDR